MRKAAATLALNALAVVFVPVIIYDQLAIMVKAALGKNRNSF